MPLPLSDKYTVRTQFIVTDTINDTPLVASDPARAVLTISNSSTAKVLKLLLGDIGSADMVLFVPLQSQITLTYRTDGLLVTARVTAANDGFVHNAGVYEMRYTG